MLRTGSETGTSQGPTYNGLVVRRINSTSSAAGQVVARTDQLRLERDGSSGGLRIAWEANTEGAQSSSCLGINSAGQSVNHYSGSLGGSIAAGTAQVFTDAQGVVYATCSFGDPLFNQHVTQVTLQRRTNDNYWIGTVISSFNQ